MSKCVGRLAQGRYAAVQAETLAVEPTQYTMSYKYDILFRM